MRLMAIILLAAGTLWGGYWFVGASAVHNGAVAFFEDRRAEGWNADYSSLGVEGFPNRFDLTVNDIVLGDPVARVTWRAPFAQLFALSYDPYHLIAALPHEQAIVTPDGTLTVNSRKMEASAAFVPGLSMTLRQAVFVADDLALVSDRGWGTAMARLRLATRAVVGRANAQEIGIEADGLRPDPAVTAAAAGPGGSLPETLDRVHFDVEAGFDAPWDAGAGARQPALTDLTLRDAVVKWGDMMLSLDGKLDVDDKGMPSGQITVHVTDWKQLLAAARGLGLIAPEMAPTFDTMFTALAKESPDPTRIALPLSVSRGWISFGLIPLAPAPRLR